MKEAAAKLFNTQPSNITPDMLGIMAAAAERNEVAVESVTPVMYRGTERWLEEFRKAAATWYNIRTRCVTVKMLRRTAEICEKKQR